MSDRSKAPSNDAIDQPATRKELENACMPGREAASGPGIPTLPPKKPARRLDPVIQALARCEQILNDLDAAEADRVLDWLQGKYGTPKQRPAQEFRD